MVPRTYASRRASLLGGTAIGSLPSARPVWTSLDFSRTFLNDYTSFPSGLYADAIVLPMKLGGLVMRYNDAGGHGVTTFAAMGRGSVSFAPSSVGTLSVSRVAGTKWATISLLGTGAAAAAYLRGKGFVTANISIGARPSADDIAYAVWGLANAIETGWTPREAMRVLSAALAGKSSNGGKTFRSLTDSKDRIVGTVDGSGNRTAVTLDPS